MLFLLERFLISNSNFNSGLIDSSVNFARLNFSRKFVRTCFVNGGKNMFEYYVFIILLFVVAVFCLIVICSE